MTHILKEPGKPKLFSFSQELEFAHIEKSLLNSRRYPQRNLEEEARMLRQLVTDYIEIIENKKISQQHLDHLEEAIIKGTMNVWNTATENLALLAYYFEEAKERIKTLICDGQAKVSWRAFYMLSDAFTPFEQHQIIQWTLNHKSKIKRCGAANTTLRLRNTQFLEILHKRLLIEKNEDVKFEIKFAIDNMHQEPGRLVFYPPSIDKKGAFSTYFSALNFSALKLGNILKKFFLSFFWKQKK